MDHLMYSAGGSASNLIILCAAVVAVCSRTMRTTLLCIYLCVVVRSTAGVIFAGWLGTVSWVTWVRRQSNTGQINENGERWPRHVVAHRYPWAGVSTRTRSVPHTHSNGNAPQHNPNC